MPDKTLQRLLDTENQYGLSALSGAANRGRAAFEVPKLASELIRILDEASVELPHLVRIEHSLSVPRIMKEALRQYGITEHCSLSIDELRAIIDDVIRSFGVIVGLIQRTRSALSTSAFDWDLTSGVASQREIPQIALLESRFINTVNGIERRQTPLKAIEISELQTIMPSQLNKRTDAFLLEQNDATANIAGSAVVRVDEPSVYLLQYAIDPSARDAPAVLAAEVMRLLIKHNCRCVTDEFETTHLRT